MPNQVGAGVYHGVRWQILRDDDKNCAVYISPPFPVPKEDLKELSFINGIISTPFIYKRRECREIARILIIGLWNNY